MSYYQRGYYNGRYVSSKDDPCPPGSDSEKLYAGLRARFGAWPKMFLIICEKAYGGKIPPRFQALAARLERERPWIQPDIEFTGLPPTITVVDSRGRLRARWRPTHAEWEEAGRLAHDAGTKTAQGNGNQGGG